jgi:NhaA family Na+:H+ antiporter
MVAATVALVWANSRQFSNSIVPVSAAVGGVAVPALVYTLINISSPATLRGRAIPAATDIAFAVAVLAIIGTHLPSALRIFLLTLAVIDDLIGISIIGVFYASYIKPWPLLLVLVLVLVPLGLFTLLARNHGRLLGARSAAVWCLLSPLGIAS